MLINFSMHHKQSIIIKKMKGRKSLCIKSLKFRPLLQLKLTTSPWFMINQSGNPMQMDNSLSHLVGIILERKETKVSAITTCKLFLLL